jgi:polyisoprenoid-binding protein YceI
MSARLLTSVLALASIVALLTGSSGTPPAAPATAAAMTIDGTHSSVLFKVMHMETANFYGRFDLISGDVALDDKGGSANVEIDAASIDTNNAGRDGHLKGPDFFSVKEFPKISFKSKTATKKGDGWEVAGDFTMHGVTKPLTVMVKQTGSAEDPKMGKKAGYESTFTVKRSDFGMTYGVDKKALGDDVTVVLSVEAAAKK